MVAQDVDMTFLEHLEELRRRITVSLIALMICTAIAYAFFDSIMVLIKWPLPDKFADLQPTVFGFMQSFMFRFKVSLICGFIFSSGFIVYQVLAFMAPAMRKNERKFIFLTLPVLLSLFLGGVAFSFFLVMPNAMVWLMNQGGGQLGFILNAEDYINFVALFALGFGVCFEAPVVIFMLIKFGIVDHKSLRKNWRVVYVASFIIASIATPDWSIVSMMALGITLIILFELSMLFARWLK
ncbi:MAG: twin-arginine translocase subunit TatC [Rubrobacteridae bacterium]|nr:twin-arginine translocase subunit TatC [Rubrobacteridae bacterium]